MTNLTVGQRIDVYEAITDGGHLRREIHKGKQAISREDGNLAYMWSPDFDISDNEYSLWIDSECKKVGTFIVKSLKP